MLYLGMRLILIFFLINLLTMSFANNIALPCYGCHISNNNKSNNSIPMIEGIDKKYFISAFHEYKNKARDNYLMQIISQGYSESEIESLADYFSNKEIVENVK